MQSRTKRGKLKKPVKHSRKAIGAGMAHKANPCPHLPGCPGCPLIGSGYKQQLAWKRQLVADVFKQCPHLGSLPIPLPVPAAQQYGYRIQAKLVVALARGGLVLGIYRQGSHVVQDITRCPLHHPLVAEAIPAIRLAMTKAGIPIHHPGNGPRGVRYVLIRASNFDKKLMLTLVSSCLPLPGVPTFLSLLRERLPLAGLYLNLNRSSGNVILGGENFRVWGRDSLAERYGKLLLAAPPTAFVQANTQQAARIYQQAATWARASAVARAVDLYCGVGGLALSLALEGITVTGIEEVRDAAKFAAANARANHITRARFLTGRVEEVAGRGLLAKADLATVNPPRKGLGDKVVAMLAGSRVREIFYISCWAPSFAKDAGNLCSLGFELVDLLLFDMLPNTDHVELLGKFRRRRAGE